MTRVDDQVYVDYAQQTLDQLAHFSLTELAPLHKRIDINVNLQLFNNDTRICPIDEEYLEDYESEAEQDARWLADEAMLNEFYDRIDFDEAYFMYGMAILYNRQEPIVTGLISFAT
jgi:hypothetical protein